MKATYSLSLELVDSLKLGIDVVGGRLESSEGLLSILNDVLVLENLAVVLKVDIGVLLLQVSKDALGFIVALAESLKRSKGFLGQADSKLGPVN